MAPGFPASLFTQIAKVLEADLTFDTNRSGPPPGDDPFADGRFDLGWICSTSYVELSLRSASPSIQLAGVAWVPDDPAADGRPVYFGDLVVPVGSTASSLDELAGLRIGCNDAISLSGHHALRFEIAERGSDPDQFAELVFTGGHDASLDLIVAGELDAAVVDSVVRTRRARSEPAVAALEVVERLGPWPVQPLVTSASMSDAERDAIAASLLESNRDPTMQAELRAAALTGFVSVGPDHYASVQRAMVSGPAQREPPERATPPVP